MTLMLMKPILKQEHSNSEILNPCVFNVSSADLCDITKTDHFQCKLKKLQVELNIKNVFDLRQLTGKFEDENFLIKAAAAELDKITTIIRIYAQKTSIQILIPLVEMRLIDHRICFNHHHT